MNRLFFLLRGKNNVPEKIFFPRFFSSGTPFRWPSPPPTPTGPHASLFKYQVKKFSPWARSTMMKAYFRKIYLAAFDEMH